MPNTIQDNIEWLAYIYNLIYTNPKIRQIFGFSFQIRREITPKGRKGDLVMNNQFFSTSHSS